MKATIKGLQHVEYTSKKTGNPVNGVTFHVERKDGDVVGGCCEQIFVGYDRLDNLGINLPPEKYKDSLGYMLEVEYNQRGFVVDIALLPPAKAS